MLLLGRGSVPKILNTFFLLKSIKKAYSKLVLNMLILSIKFKEKFICLEEFQVLTSLKDRKLSSV